MVRTSGLNNYSDVHYTDVDVAKHIVDFYGPTLPCLEPFAGSGIFLQFLPVGTEWCEIEKGIDFDSWTKPVEWIVTNPPFEEMTRWMCKSFSVATNVVFLLPLSKLFSSVPRMNLVKEFGGIKTILYLGSGRSIGFDLGFAFGAVHFQKSYKGPVEMIWDS